MILIFYRKGYFFSYFYETKSQTHFKNLYILGILVCDNNKKGQVGNPGET